MIKNVLLAGVVFAILVGCANTDTEGHGAMQMGAGVIATDAPIDLIPSALGRYTWTVGTTERPHKPTSFQVWDGICWT